jgi:putative ABC transport system ATP-binding protein
MADAGVEAASRMRRNDGAKTVVSFADVHFSWPGRVPFTMTIDRFSLAAGERLLLLGPSGSGKSTFLSLLAGIVTPQSGRIDILSSDMTKLGSAARDHFRAEHFGIIFQMFNLLPYGSIVDNVVLPLHFAKGRRARAEAEGSLHAVAQRLLLSLGLDAFLIEDGAAASRLSVGQQQRVAAARALIGGPEIIVADEPTSALDRNLQGAFLELLFGEVETSGGSVIMVSHDESLAGYFDRVVRLDDIAVTSRGARP